MKNGRTLVVFEIILESFGLNIEGLLPFSLANFLVYLN